MFVEMNCGRCESYFQIESEEEDPLWLLVHRFTNSHVECGFMTPTATEEDGPIKKKIIKPRLTEESEGA